jgi:UDP-N-acetylglucosamine--N-acetylmuramyl-(pentapeptide) pyrophosphoryl-undecaprenol N-acetylglucosamine transferase
MADRGLKIIIAGGGTGGHIFPGVAIAEEFLKKEEASILFVGTGNKLETDILGGLGFNYSAIRVAGFKGKGPLRALAALGKLPVSMWESYRIIRDFRPHLVIGVGGYASGPVVLIAHLLGIKTAVAEQNALPGLANRILGKFADRVFLTYRETKKWFPQKSTMVTGNPVRAEFLPGNRVKKERESSFTILVFGGSQGARSINRAFLGALPHLCAEKLKMRIIHQTGPDDLSYAAGVYRTCEIEAEVLPFIRDMAAAYQAADLVICRAGATSLAEITVLGKAAILIPFPFAVDDHQTKNAIEMVRAGAAVLIEEKQLTGEEMAATVKLFYHHRELLRDMEIKSAALGNIRAAADIVEQCVALL